MMIISRTRCAFALGARGNLSNSSAGDNKLRKLLNKYVVDREACLRFTLRYVRRPITLITHNATRSFVLTLPVRVSALPNFRNWSRGPWIRLGPGLTAAIKNGLLAFFMSEQNWFCSGYFLHIFCQVKSTGNLHFNFFSFFFLFFSVFHTQHPAIINFAWCFNTSYKISFATVLVALVYNIRVGVTMQCLFRNRVDSVTEFRYTLQRLNSCTEQQTSQCNY
jgi:hypothetical protein